MQFMKIKFKKADGIHITYTEQDRDFDLKETVFTSPDEPMESFKSAMQALLKYAEEICELPAGYLTETDAVDINTGVGEPKGTVTGVSFSYSNENIMGATITVLRKLSGAQSPLVINTPHLPECSEGDFVLPSLCVDALRLLQAEADLYMAGERATKQGSVFDMKGKKVA